MRQQRRNRVLAPRHRVAAFWEVLELSRLRQGGRRFLRVGAEEPCLLLIEWSWGMRLHGGELVRYAWQKLRRRDDQSAVFAVRDGLAMGLEVLQAPVRIVTVGRRNGRLQALLG